MGISSLRLHPTNETLLAATSLEGLTALYDIRQAGPAALVIRGHSGAVNTSLFMDNGNYLATGSDDRTIRVTDLRLPDALATIATQKEAVNVVISDPLNANNLIAGADDGCVYVHTYEAAESGAKWKGIDNFMVSSGTVNDILVLPSASGLYVTASEEGSIRVWNRDAKQDCQMEDRIVQSYDEFESAVNHLHLTQKIVVPSMPLNGNKQSWLFAASAQYVFGTSINHETGELGEENLAFGLHSDYVRGIEAITESTLLTVSDDCTAVMWEAATGRPLVQAKLHEQMIMAMAVGYSNGTGEPTVLFTGSEDGSISMWNLPLEGPTPEFNNTAAHFPRQTDGEWEEDA